MTQERMLARAKSMVIGVVCCGRVGGANFAGEEGLAFEVCFRALAGVHEEGVRSGPSDRKSCQIGGEP